LFTGIPGGERNRPEEGVVRWGTSTSEQSRIPMSRIRSTHPVRALAALLVTFALALSACGDDDSDPVVTDPGQSEDEMSDDEMSEDEMSEDEMSEEDEMSDDEMSDDEMSDDEMSEEGGS
jgi:pentapeptide MXKDX repeat protein